jgi:hypothetical protein
VISTPVTQWRINSENAKLLCVHEGRKRVLLITASILAARKLSAFDGGKRVPATLSAIADAVRMGEEIMKAIEDLFSIRIRRGNRDRVQ